MTAASDDQYRLTPDDETRAASAMATILRSWREHMDTFRPSADMVPTLERIGAHALGCGLHDLRDSERAWIEARARLTLDTERTTP